MARPQLKISVPKPCSENWNVMTPQAKGRFCASCATTVIDFSQFTDKQLLEYFTKPSGKICGRFTASQLNRPVYSEFPPKQNFFPRLVAAAALFLGISSQTQAQIYHSHPVPTGQNVEQAAGEKETPTKTIGETPEKVSGGGLVIEGRVIDSETKESIPFGNVLLKDTKIYAQTDIEGRFKIVIPDTFQVEEFTLYMTNIGYKAGEFLIDRRALPIEQDFLIKQGEVLGDLVVITEYRKTPGYYLRNFWWKTKNLFRRNN